MTALNSLSHFAKFSVGDILNTCIVMSKLARLYIFSESRVQNLRLSMEMFVNTLKSLSKENHNI